MYGIRQENYDFVYFLTANQQERTLIKVTKLLNLEVDMHVSHLLAGFKCTENRCRSTGTSLCASKLKIVKINITHNLKLNHVAFFKKKYFD